MRAVTRLSQVIRGLSTNVGKGAASSAPADPLKNVVGAKFSFNVRRILVESYFQLFQV